ncbi:MAG: ASPIC/UnbV domain-containing protein [Phycisphaerales bacterium]
MPTRSYLSQVPARAWFGLGAAAGDATVEVTWPDGRTTSHPVAPGTRGTLPIER